LIKDKQDEEDQYKYWQLWLIKKDNVVIGICGLYSLYPHATDELWLSWFGIIPEFRSTGIGGIVLEWLKTKAKILGCNRLMSYVDKKGYPLEFYYRHKFSIVASTKEYLRSHPELSADSFGSGNDHIIGTAL
jgi:GNAT superfamily N-acetyltransferase